MIETSADLGALARQARLSQGWSQADLAEMLGTTQRWVSEFERGENNATLAMTLRLLHSLGIVLTGTAPTPTNEPESEVEQEIGFGMKI